MALMGEARRRRLAGYRPQALAPSPWPEELRDDIAAAVQSLTIPTGGPCFLRTFLGELVFQTLGVYPTIYAGAMLYRAGPDAYKDTVAFCSYGNIADLVDGGLVGHLWLEVGNDYVDFSPIDWPMYDALRMADPALFAQLPNAADEHAVGAITWQVPPPRYYWRPRSALTAGWRSTRGRALLEADSPAIGDVWYHPGVRTTSRETLDRAVITVRAQVAQMLREMPIMLATIDTNIRIRDLGRRVRAIMPALRAAGIDVLEDPPFGGGRLRSQPHALRPSPADAAEGRGVR
jgi:hypothetical protein